MIRIVNMLNYHVVNRFIELGGVMDIQEIQEKFEDLLLANPDFDESLLGKDEEGCYSDSDIQHMYSMFEAGTEVREQWQSAKAQAVPEGFVLVEKAKLMQIIGSVSMIEPITRGNPYMDSVKRELTAITDVVKTVIEAQEPAND